MSPGSTYQPLADYLTAQAVDEMTLSFDQIEAILRRRLPSSAYLRGWWTGRSANQARTRSWRATGWEATASEPRDDDRWVTFVRRR